MIESGGNNKYYDPPERDYAYSRHFGFVQKVVVGWMVVMLGEQGTSFHPLIPTCGRQVQWPDKIINVFRVSLEVSEVLALSALTIFSMVLILL